MKHDKMTAKHYEERIDFYKGELRSYIIAEISFEITDDISEILKKDADDKLIEYIVDRYNSVYIDNLLDHYINSSSFIEALGEDKQAFAEELREELLNEYHNQMDQITKELQDFIGSSKSTLEEKVTAGFLSDDPKSLIIYLNNAYNVWLSKQYGDEYVMRLITNPEKLDLFISKNKVLLDVITQTIEDNLFKLENQKEYSENGLLVDETI